MKKPEFIKLFVERYPIWGNRYFLAIFIFLTWVMFFDQNSLISQYQERQGLYDLKKEKRYYQTEIKKTKEDLNDLFYDTKSLEKFAREHYFMKKADEEVWLVTDSTKKAE